MHYHIIVIYTHNKVHRIKSIAYLVMAEERINYLNASKQRGITTTLTLCLLGPPADNLCIQFGPRADPTCADPEIFIRNGVGRGTSPTDRKKPLVALRFSVT